MSFPGPIGGDLLARRYRLIDRVGAGGMSVVWRARDEVLDRLVAVKWLGTELADDDLYRELVRREAWATARIKHPAVAAVYDYGEVSDRHGQSLAYVVMEMLDGESLSDRLRRGPVPWPEAISIAAEVADALATAHEHGVVHRDVSPDNVMLTSSGLRVFDFGIAAPVGEPDDDSTGSTFGTPAYVAPERLDGQPAQTATDVYSLGVLIYEMVTGQPPFPEDTWSTGAGLTARAAPRPRAAGLPPGVARLCQQCLAHQPAQRPSAREVAERLAAYQRPSWRGKAVAIGSVAVVATLAALIALMPWAGAPDPTSAPTSPGGAGVTTPAEAATPPTSAPAASPSSRPAASQPVRTGPPTPPPGGQPPPVASIPVEQALDNLRATISGAVPEEMDSNNAVDLLNYVENISNKLIGDPDANVRTDVSALLTHVRNRAATSKDSEGNRSISVIAEQAIVAAIKDLNTALGYPPLT
jgi:serine/threonine-protein kinase